MRIYIEVLFNLNLSIHIGNDRLGTPSLVTTIDLDATNFTSLVGKYLLKSSPLLLQL